jgi:EAL domain-containing protein (putative c-di-GMP-specific phosphodiesterase class I)
MEDLAALGRAILQASAPTATMRRVVEQALLLVPSAEGSAVALLDGDEMTYVCCAGSLAAAVGLKLRLGDSLSGLSLREASTLRCDDAINDPRVDREACRRVGATSMVCVPLCSQDVPVGVLKVVSATTSAFNDEDVAVLAALADFIATAITTSSELNEATSNALRAVAKIAPSMSKGGHGRASKFLANVLRPGLAEGTEAFERTRQAVANRAFDVVYQPEFDLQSGALVGVEALARFASVPYRPPNLWFKDAHKVGLGKELELAAATKALAQAHMLPKSCFIAVNLGPGAIANPDSICITEVIDPRRLVIELTEHVQVDDYPLLRRVLHALRQRGTRLAVDDTGSGFSSFAHIVELAPDIIKLDIDLVRGIDADPVRRSLATAVVAFATQTGAKVAAEGIETASELACLRSLGIHYGQGYFLGRPGPMETFAAYTQREQQAPAQKPARPRRGERQCASLNGAAPKGAPSPRA